MADADWDSVTRIGSKARSGGGGGVDRERVIKGKSAINAASRSGAIVATEKKYAGANTKSSVEGQHLTKVDRSDEIVKPKTVGKDIGTLIMKRRNEMVPKMTQTDLARKCNTQVGIIQGFESGNGPRDQVVLNNLEKALNIRLQGNAIGEPKFGPKDSKTKK